VAVASAGPYASLHLDPDRQPRQHPTTQVFYRPDALPAAQPKASKHLKSNTIYTEYAESSEKILCLLAVCMVNNDYKKISFLRRSILEIKAGV